MSGNASFMGCLLQSSEFLFMLGLYTMTTSMGISLISEMSLNNCMYYLIHGYSLACVLATDMTLSLVT